MIKKSLCLFIFITQGISHSSEKLTQSNPHLKTLDISTLPESLTPLMEAAAKNNIQSIKQLLSNPHLNINESNEMGRTALFYAINLGHIESIELLLENNADIHYQTITGTGSVATAIASLKLEVIKLIVEKGGDMNLSNYNKALPIMAFMDVIQEGAVTKEKAEEILDFLISLGLDINKTSSHGATVLHYCCLLKCKKDLIDLLISRGANVNCIDINGETPLMYSTYQNNSDMISLLHSYGANVHHENNWGKTAAIIAREKKHLVSLLVISKLLYPDNTEMAKEFRKNKNSKRKHENLFAQKLKGLINNEVIRSEDAKYTTYEKEEELAKQNLFTAKTIPTLHTNKITIKNNQENFEQFWSDINLSETSVFISPTGTIDSSKQSAVSKKKRKKKSKARSSTASQASAGFEEEQEEENEQELALISSDSNFEHSAPIDTVRDSNAVKLFIPQPSSQENTTQANTTGESFTVVKKKKHIKQSGSLSEKETYTFHPRIHQWYQLENPSDITTSYALQAQGYNDPKNKKRGHLIPYYMNKWNITYEEAKKYIIYFHTFPLQLGRAIITYGQKIINEKNKIVELKTPIIYVDKTAEKELSLSYFMGEINSTLPTPQENRSTIFHYFLRPISFYTFNRIINDEDNNEVFASTSWNPITDISAAENNSTSIPVQNKSLFSWVNKSYHTEENEAFIKLSDSHEEYIVYKNPSKK